MGKSPRSETIELFDGKSLDDWAEANDPVWQAVDGEIVGSAPDGNNTMHCGRSFDGDIDVRMEARLIEDCGGGPLCFGIRPCFHSLSDGYSLGVLRGHVVWGESTDAGQLHEVVSVAPPDLKKPFDVKQWNT
jgi:hypothetical protein